LLRLIISRALRDGGVTVLVLAPTEERKLAALTAPGVLRQGFSLSFASSDRVASTAGRSTGSGFDRKAR
jgi:hypothetical protein